LQGGQTSPSPNDTSSTPREEIPQLNTLKKAKIQLKLDYFSLKTNNKGLSPSTTPNSFWNSPKTLDSEGNTK
jgi:hypothetical protein